MTHDEFFADRINDVPKSFIREILKVAINPEVISFAGGLPNRNLFPIKDFQQAANDVFEQSGAEALQYSNSEGNIELREFIAKRYWTKNKVKVSAENILITSGSQQGLDLLAKVLLNEQDTVLIEKPGYLGAIQLFSLYQTNMHAIPIHPYGMDIQCLKEALEKRSPKLAYMVPSFQNPSGITYSELNRQEVCNLFKNSDCLLVEDNPYGELCFTGKQPSLLYEFLPQKTILLGSFSKITVPGLRLGWMVAPSQIMEKLVIAKQASDLHTNNFAQHLLLSYLKNTSLDNHIQKIQNTYGEQCKTMIKYIEEYFPLNQIQFTKPDGGMFLWVTLPEKMDAMELFNVSISENVAFVPGTPFYLSKEEGKNTLRLNFSCVNHDQIEKGIRILAKCTRKLLV